MKTDLKIKAIKLRKEGYSINELHKNLSVSKSTLSLWFQNIELSKKAKKRLFKNYTKGQVASQKIIKEKTKQKNIQANNFAFNLLSKVNLSTDNALLLCSLIYQCEGSKNIRDYVTFTNSDPDLIKTFLFLFRSSFILNENKFRVLMHLHKYHDENKQKDFWSKATGISKEQFNNTYFKPSSAKYKKEGYQGCIQVSYNDVAIGRQLYSVAKMFMEGYK